MKKMSKIIMALFTALILTSCSIGQDAMDKCVEDECKEGVLGLITELDYGLTTHLVDEIDEDLSGINIRVTNEFGGPQYTFAVRLDEGFTKEIYYQYENLFEQFETHILDYYDLEEDDIFLNMEVRSEEFSFHLKSNNDIVRILLYLDNNLQELNSYNDDIKHMYENSSFGIDIQASFKNQTDETMLLLSYRWINYYILVNVNITESSGYTEQQIQEYFDEHYSEFPVSVEIVN